MRHYLYRWPLRQTALPRRNGGLGGGGGRIPGGSSEDGSRPETGRSQRTAAKSRPRPGGFVQASCPGAFPIGQSVWGARGWAAFLPVRRLLRLLGAIEAPLSGTDGSYR